MTRSWLALALALLLAVLAVACAQILGIRPPQARPFPHHEHLVHNINCRDCHAGIATATDESGMHIPDTASCVRCHQKPHDANTCLGCHGQAYTREGAQSALDTLKFQHKTHVARQHGECVHCHSGVETSSDHIRPTMALCLSCHEHQDDFAQNRTCDRCHKDIRGEQVKPSSHMVHDGDWLREHGQRAGSARELCSTCHADKFCGSCHGKTVPLLQERMAFDDPLRAGIHRAGWMARHPLEARDQPGMCTTCHTPDTCESCHARNHVSVGSPGSRSPHPAGWVGLRGEPNDHGRAAWRDPSVCASCHQGAGEQLCIGCHRVGGIGGNPHRAGWTSKMRPTIDQPCRSCHGGTP